MSPLTVMCLVFSEKEEGSFFYPTSSAAYHIPRSLPTTPHSYASVFHFEICSACGNWKSHDGAVGVSASSHHSTRCISFLGKFETPSEQLPVYMDLA